MNSSRRMRLMIQRFTQNAIPFFYLHVTNILGKYPERSQNVHKSAVKIQLCESELAFEKAVISW